MTFNAHLSDLPALAPRVRRADTGMWAASVLRDRIAAGQLAPGVKLSEETLGTALGVSRNTLREAFSTLAAENIVTRIPNRGVFVTQPSAADIREIYRVRRYLEPAALLWTPQTQSARLHDALTRARAARAARSAIGMASANQDFHAGVVALAGSERLDRLMNQVLAEMRLVFFSMQADPGFHAPFVDGNARVLHLFDTADRQAAAAALTEYLQSAERQLLAAHAAAV